MTKKTNLHLEIQYPKTNPVGILRNSYRQGGKIKHDQFGRIKGKTLQELKMLQLAFKNKVVADDDPNAFQIAQSKEYGASAAILKLAKNLGLERILSYKKEWWVNSGLAMVVGRLVYAGSKLALSHQSENSSLWDLVNIGQVDVDKHCYKALDELLANQNSIQKKLAKKHLQDGHLVLYDITSSYLEGEYKNSELVKFGYNRDGKKGHEQVVIGLLCSKEGCPVAIEVYPGNTKDETTVIDKIKEIKNKYNIKKVIFVGDRGMVTKSNIEKLSSQKDIFTISALTHKQIFDLLKNNTIQPSLFDEDKIHEVIDPENPSKRYCLCKNPLSAQKDKTTRERLLALTEESLKKISDYKQKTTVAILGSRIGRILNKYKMGKFIEWDIHPDQELKSINHKVTFKIDYQAISKAESLDGCYIISSDVPTNEMNSNEIVASYKKLELVETAFRNLKTVSLEIRPIYHKTDKRIKAHIFLCMLAYYIQWHMTQKLKPLFTGDGNGKKRKWTFTNVIQTLKQITKNNISLHKVNFTKISNPTYEQQQILNLLEIKL